MPRRLNITYADAVSVGGREPVQGTTAEMHEFAPCFAQIQSVLDARCASQRAASGLQAPHRAGHMREPAHTLFDACAASLLRSMFLGGALAGALREASGAGARQAWGGRSRQALLAGKSQQVLTRRPSARDAGSPEDLCTAALFPCVGDLVRAPPAARACAPNSYGAVPRPAAVAAASNPPVCPPVLAVPLPLSAAVHPGPAPPARRLRRRRRHVCGKHLGLQAAPCAAQPAAPCRLLGLDACHAPQCRCHVNCQQHPTASCRPCRYRLRSWRRRCTAPSLGMTRPRAGSRTAPPMPTPHLR